MKLQKIFSRVLDVLILLVFVLFFASAGFQDRMTSGWYQQWFPNLNGSSIQDITFLDSLNGFAVTNSNSLLQEYILRTTNGGDNWTINYTFTTPNSNWSFVKVAFINSNTGFAFSWTEMFKTTDGGNNWDMIVNNLYCGDFSVINKDTMFAVSSSGFDGGVYRTINGGLNWSMIWTGGTVNPEKIYMVDKNLGFIRFASYPMQRTTNGGFNWTLVTGEYYGAIKFYDINTGWKIWDSLKKTTNGGINWITQQTPNISYYFTDPSDFSVLNKDTVWMVGAEIFHKPPVYKTTNGGLNWGYQYPDTTLQVYKFGFVQFVNSKAGWINPASPTSLMHTKVGGNDTTYITNINNNINVEISDYQLFQNYPNPFNPTTKIKYKISSYSGSTTVNVRIVVFDIQGKEIATLVNQKLLPGNYETNFNGINLHSGIYFYSLIIDGKPVDTKKMIFVK